MRWATTVNGKLFFAGEHTSSSYRGTVHGAYLQGQKAADAILTAAAVSPTGFVPENGWWWNSTEGGRGYSIETRNRRLFMAAYMYRDDGSAVWYVASGAISGGTFTGSALEYGGTQTIASTPPNTGSTSTTAANVSISFTSSIAATITWSGGQFGASATTAITRYPISGSSSPAASLAGAPETGWWWNANEGGTGYFVEQQGSQIFMAFYLYGTDQRAVWYYALGTPVLSGANVVFTAPLSLVAGGQTLTGPKKATSSTTTAGTVTVIFDTSTTGSLTLPNGRKVALTRFTSF